MGVSSKSSVLFLLLVLAVSSAQKPRIIAEARTISFLAEQNHSKIFATLGVVCKCCDGEQGECRRIWKKGSCHNLQCLPWKIG
ncbi:hypothetical protein MANES_09G098400v8 [Manihot esculenta]|uniref:Uncharacterized protein n=1 Tax=Manihot esculenta TaxID=3983 RepID=A0A2C9VBM9_MANES|nr:hypothetical protein MANES_09G098400v8 [Manihot esculenta]